MDLRPRERAGSTAFEHRRDGGCGIRQQASRPRQRQGRSRCREVDGHGRRLLRTQRPQVRRHGRGIAAPDRAGERRELLSAALDAGAQGIDLEGWEAWQPPAGRSRCR